jgi:hypothetical protein
MGALGADRVRREFSLASITQQYATLYEELTQAA